MAAALLLTTGFAGPSRGESLFDSSFIDGDDASEWTAEGKWSVSRRPTEMALESGKPGNSLSRDIEAKAGEPLTLLVDYGWRSGRGQGQFTVALADAQGESLIVSVEQAAGEKYKVAWDGKAAKPFGVLDDDRLDAGVQAGGESVVPVTMILQIDGNQLKLRRLDGESVTAELPQAFSPKSLTITDTSRENKNLRLARVRAYSGAVDPVDDVVHFSLPFGGSFVEGAAPTMRLMGKWISDESRPAKISVTATVLPETQGGQPAGFNHQLDLVAGQVAEFDAGAFALLAPGLYRIEGRVSVGDHTLPIEGTLGIFSKELAERPLEDIPQWVGIVPFINILHRGVYEESFEYMQSLGVRHVRWLPGWGRLEPEKGEYDWAETDEFVDLALHHKMQILFCLSYYGGDWTQELRGGSLARTPEGREMWVEHFAVPTIKRYGDRVKLYQIWNEPDAFWNEDPEKARGFAHAFATPSNYFDLVKRTHKAAHDLGIKDLRIMASLSSGEIPQHTKLLFEMGLGKIFDGMIIHTYGHHVRHFEEQRQRLAKLGHKNPALGSGEVGLPRGSDWDGSMRQARHVLNAMLSSASIPDLLAVEWFVLHDTIAGGNFGLITPEHQPHPAAMTYFTAAHLLAGAESGKGQVERRGMLNVYNIPRKGRVPLFAVANSGSPTLVTFSAKGKDTPVVWDMLGRNHAIEVEGGQFTVDLNEGVFIEGDVQIVKAVQPSIAVSMNDQGQATVRLSLGKGNTDADATAGLSVSDLNFDEQQPLDNRGDAMFTLPTMEAGRQHDAMLSVTTAGSTMSQPIILEATPIYRVTKKEIDSIIAPDRLPTITLSGEDNFRKMASHRVYGGPDDSSAEIKIGWNDDVFVLWIAEQDDKHVKIPPAAPNPWGYDSGQWAFQPEGDLAQGVAFTEVTFGIHQAGDEPMARVMGQPHFSPAVLAERDGSVTRYRLTLPLAQLGIEPEAGRSVGMAVNLNDNDGAGRKGWLYFGEGVYPPKNPSQYRRVILSDGKPQQAEPE